MMRSAHWMIGARTIGACLVGVGLVALGTIAGCSSDSNNAPPTIAIVLPADGAAITDSTVVLGADARDDSGVSRVRFSIGGELVATVTAAPWEATAAVGRWASGQPVEVTADVRDDAGVSASADPISITVDPSLQTIPQITSVDADDSGGTSLLRAQWLVFPLALDYAYAVARDSLFTDIVLTGTTQDTTVTTTLPATGVYYVRARANTLSETSQWSVPHRYVNLPRFVTTVAVTGNQLGALPVVLADADGLVVLSQAVPRFSDVPDVAPQLLGLTPTAGLSWQQSILAAAQPPVASVADDAGLVVAAGDGTVVRFALADGSVQWQTALTDVTLGALSGDGAGGWLTAGRTTAGDGAVIRLDAGGTEQDRIAFALEADRTVRQVWELASGMFVVVGDITNSGGSPAGVWLRGLASDGSEVWNTRLGTSDAYFLRGGALRDGRVALAGQSFTSDLARRRGFVATFDAAAGYLRWLTTIGDWTQASAIAPSVGGRWGVTGYWREDDGSTRFTVGELTDGGRWRWRVTRAMGRQAMGWGVVGDGQGGITAVGAQSNTGTAWDLIVLRADDHGVIGD